MNDKRLALEAMQVRVIADRQTVEVAGIIVADSNESTTTERTWALPFPGGVIITPFQDAVPYAA